MYKISVGTRVMCPIKKHFMIFINTIVIEVIMVFFNKEDVRFIFKDGTEIKV